MIEFLGRIYYFKQKSNMKTNGFFTIFAAFVLCLTFLSVSATAQKRKPAKRPAKPTVATTAFSVGDVKDGVQKVSTQLKNLSRFIYNYGNVAQIIEDLDKEIRAGRASRNAPDLNAKNKRAVLATIRDFRAGLAALEVEFRTKPALKNYLSQINGITDIAGSAEDQAADGQFVESGKTLLLVVEKLADTLAAMP